MPEEMIKLREMLTAMGIKWHDKSDIGSFTIYRTHFKYKGVFHSVICGLGSFGGRVGLLEIMVGSHEPTGYHTAEDIIKILKGEKA